MALLIPVGYAQAVFSLQLSGDDEPIVNTLGVLLEDSADPTYANIANYLKQAYNDTLMQHMSDQYSLTHVTLYVGEAVGDPSVHESTSSPTSGLLTVAPLPQNCAWLLRKRTGLAGRRGRGRCYIPGIPEGQVDATGTIDTGVLGTLNTLAAAFLTRLQTEVGGVGPCPPVVLHREEGAGVEPAPTFITQFAADAKIATQRNRLRK